MKKMTTKSRRPFEESMNQLIKLGANDLEAVQIIQGTVNRFTDKNNEVKKRIDEQASSSARDLNGKLVTLSTLLITIIGVLITQKSGNIAFTSHQKSAIIVLFISLILSIIFGVMDYFEAGKFFRKWQKATIEVTKSVDDEIIKGNIQKISDIYEIESSIMGDLPNSSGDRYLYFQLTLTLCGAVSFMFVIASILYDLPIIR